RRGSLPPVAFLSMIVNQRYQLPANLTDGRVHQRYVKLAGRGEFFPRHRQAAFNHVGGLSTAAGEPADQFLPGRWLQKDEQGVVLHDLADLPRAIEVDLEQRRLIALDALTDRFPRR